MRSNDEDSNVRIRHLWSAELAYKLIRTMFLDKKASAQLNEGEMKVQFP